MADCLGMQRTRSKGKIKEKRKKEKKERKIIIARGQGRRNQDWDRVEENRDGEEITTDEYILSRHNLNSRALTEWVRVTFRITHPKVVDKIHGHVETAIRPSYHLASTLRMYRHELHRTLFLLARERQRA
ncbi:hypothetical protein ALC53_03128 [Atta colombica]|uniref:Uncharacterized protein n=1 Tax=Atta colombica TaxID=520822 RepID=A0A195BRR4_9HYME|nr:hypothetical protein ALC53_03128 [Atta colombica]